MVRCKQCQYSLKALTEHRCPECGRVFDPNDDTTFSDQWADDEGIGWTLAALATTFAMHFLMLTLFWVTDSFDSITFIIWAIIMLGTPVIAAVVVTVVHARRQAADQ